MDANPPSKQQFTPSIHPVHPPLDNARNKTLKPYPPLLSTDG